MNIGVFCEITVIAAILYYQYISYSRQTNRYNTWHLVSYCFISMVLCDFTYLLCFLSVKDTVAVFLKHHSVRDEPDLEGRTAFMWAAGKGSDDVIKIMLDLKKDLDINMTDKYGGTGV